MPRYIDADEFEKLIKPYDTDDRVEKAFHIFGHCTMAQVPTADVRENVHGRWVKRKVLEQLAWDVSPIDLDEYDEETHSEWVEKICCSNCDYQTLIGKTNFCPNCGADMRERGEDER